MKTREKENYWLSTGKAALCFPLSTILVVLLLRCWPSFSRMAESIKWVATRTKVGMYLCMSNFYFIPLFLHSYSFFFFFLFFLFSPETVSVCRSFYFWNPTRGGWGPFVVSTNEHTVARNRCSNKLGGRFIVSSQWLRRPPFIVPIPAFHLRTQNTTPPILRVARNGAHQFLNNFQNT